MGEPMNAARGLEPDPIPSDVPATAPVRGDIERGYNRPDGVETPGSDVTVHRDRKGSAAPSERGEKSRTRGKGLTEGDAGTSTLPRMGVEARADMGQIWRIYLRTTWRL